MKLRFAFIACCIFILIGITYPKDLASIVKAENLLSVARTTNNSTTTTFQAISAGSAQTCAITSIGGIKCWGDNVGGILGDNSQIRRSTPTDVQGISSGATSVSIGAFHACAVVGGLVKCWGNNTYGQLGNGTTTNSMIPVNVTGISNGVEVGVGQLHSCARTADEAVFCWGANLSGQLGTGVLSPLPTSSPVAVNGLSSGVTDLSVGANSTCVVVAGAAKCWGSNFYGQIGNGGGAALEPAQVSGLSSGVSMVSAGGAFACALTDGGVKCWGENGGGQLGNDSTIQSNIPVNVNGLGIDSGVTSISAGSWTACAIQNGGAICWGTNTFGQIGDGTTTNRLTPVSVNGLSNAVLNISAGGQYACAIIEGGMIKCWGANQYSQLGNGAITYRATPLDVSNLPVGLTSIAIGFTHSCASTSSGSVKCWGNNANYQLGDGSRIHSSIPVEVVNLTNAASVVAGAEFSCALTTSNGVKCWGSGSSGQLGHGSFNSSPTPVDVTGLTSDVVAITSGLSHACAVKSDGSVVCWGKNDKFQLGNNGGNSNVPVQVTNLGIGSGATSIAAGGTHTCAIVNSSVQCWGNNQNGQLGNGSVVNSYTPVTASSLTSEVTALSVGGNHSCALHSSGMMCWGNNLAGQLGDGTTLQRNSPTPVSNLSSGVTSISAMSSYTCAIKDGGLKCWGYNGSAQLGDGTITNRSLPVDVGGLSDEVGLLVKNSGPSSQHVCALTSNGRARCWGSDTFGQLGVGTIIFVATPIDIIEKPTPSLILGYDVGQPNSYFTVTGWNFPPGGIAKITVNGTILASDVPVNLDGSFVVFLSSDGADPGTYNITATVNPTATKKLVLSDVGELHPQEGGGRMLALPLNSGFNHFYFLPAVGK